ncbi:MAG: N-acetylmuramoyl-L-alanine amidase [bacterium]
MIKIDKDTHWVKEENTIKTKKQKKQIIIGFSLREGHKHLTRLYHKDFGKSKEWNTFTITRDGEIFQHFDTQKSSDYIGVKEYDEKSISIVLENMGCLNNIDNNTYVNWLNEKCNINRVVNKNWMGYKYWEKFNDTQIMNTIELCKQLCDQFDIPKQCIEFNHYNESVNKFNGIVFKSNYIEDSGSINPLFNISVFNKNLKK